jgi:hypothetical protein
LGVHCSTSIGRWRKRQIAPPMIDSKDLPSGWVVAGTRMCGAERLVNIGTRLPGRTV